MRKILIIAGLFIGLTAFGRTTAKEITVNSGKYARKDCVVKVELNDAPKAVKLIETTNGAKAPTECQIVKDAGKTWLYFTLTGNTAAGATRTYELSKGKATKATPEMNVVDDGDNIILKSGSKEIMSYRYTTNISPEGVSHRFDRSGYIHPAKTPSGFVYTNIQPRDHYHHYGIWNPWTRVEYDGKVYDLWNLGDSLGTVRAKNIDDIYQGDVLSGFNASLDHFAFTPSGEKKIIEEEWKIRAVDQGEGFLWDFESVLEPTTNIPVTIKAYRYQGFSCRATPMWREVSMMTSEGLTRPDIDGSTARWIYVNGKTRNGVKAGFMFMATPQNYNSPEPLRIWVEGDVYVNFCPTKTTDWKLEPGGVYNLNYRVMAYDGEMTPENAERLWTDFVYPPVVTIK